MLSVDFAKNTLFGRAQEDIGRVVPGQISREHSFPCHFEPRPVKVRGGLDARERKGDLCKAFSRDHIGRFVAANTLYKYNNIRPYRRYWGNKALIELR